MLEKNENIFYFDAHFHLADCVAFDVPSNWAACSCSHSIEEWEVVQTLRQAQGPHIYSTPPANESTNTLSSQMEWGP